MTYLLEIKETPESKPLIQHLRTLKYVKMKKAEGRFQREAIIEEVRKSEKSRKIKWNDAKKKIASWK